jgi:hypothetical protein
LIECARGWERENFEVKRVEKVVTKAHWSSSEQIFIEKISFLEVNFNVSYTNWMSSSRSLKEIDFPVVKSRKLRKLQKCSLSNLRANKVTQHRFLIIIKAETFSSLSLHHVAVNFTWHVVHCCQVFIPWEKKRATALT